MPTCLLASPRADLCYRLAGICVWPTPGYHADTCPVSHRKSEARGEGLIPWWVHIQGCSCDYIPPATASPIPTILRSPRSLSSTQHSRPPPPHGVIYWPHLTAPISTEKASPPPPSSQEVRNASRDSLPDKGRRRAGSWPATLQIRNSEQLGRLHSSWNFPLQVSKRVFLSPFPKVGS